MRRGKLLTPLLFGLALATFGCRSIRLGEIPFEPEGPMCRIRPAKIRLIVPAVQGKENTSIPGQESWTKMLALTFLANGHEVGVGGAIPSDLLDAAAGMGIEDPKIGPDRGDSDITFEVKGYVMKSFALDFEYGKYLGQAQLSVEVRLKGQTDGLIREYMGYSVGATEDVSQAQQWCAWDLTRDPEIIALVARASAL